MGVCRGGHIGSPSWKLGLRTKSASRFRSIKFLQ